MNLIPRTPASVVEADLCIGCGLCAVAFPDKVDIVMDQGGFLTARERQRLDRSQRSEFVRLCPGLGYRAPSGPRVEHDWAWGPVRDAYIGWARDEQVRALGSSGGVLTAIASVLMETGEVDAVVGISAHADHPFENKPAVVRTAADATRLAGSRYAPAAPMLGLRSVGPDESVAVIGKPCDVGGLRSMGGPGVAQPDVRYVLSFFCAGTPSSNATRDLSRSMGIEEADVSSVAYRGGGWPGRFRVRAKDGREADTSYSESWGSVLNKQLHTRCKLCRDGVGSLADIVVADYWEVDDRGYPLFEEGSGQSLVIVRTEAGAKLSQLIEGAVSLTPVSLDRLPRIQPYQFHRARYAFARGVGRWLARGSAPRFPGFAGARFLLSHPVTSAREAWGTFRRQRRGRLTR